MRLTVRAKPGSRHESVTLDRLDGPSGVLVVRVRARAVDGAANRAVILAVAGALGVRRSAVTLASGEKGRIKNLAIDADYESLRSALARLPAAGADRGSQ